MDDTNSTAPNNPFGALANDQSQDQTDSAVDESKPSAVQSGEAADNLSSSGIDSGASAQNTDAEVLQSQKTSSEEDAKVLEEDKNDNPNAKWYVVHTYSGHENRVATSLKQRVESEHLEHKILEVLVPTQEKIEIRGGKKGTVKEKIFPGYILVKMVLDDDSWLVVRTTQGVTSFVGMGNKPTPVPESEVKTIVRFMTQGATPTFKDVFLVDDTVKIIDGPFAEFIGKIDGVDKEHGKVKVLVSIFGRETPVELDFLQVQKL